MSFEDDKWREDQRSCAWAGIVSMKDLLDSGNRDDAVYVLGKLVGLMEYVSDCNGISAEETKWVDNARDNLNTAYSLTGDSE